MTQKDLVTKLLKDNKGILTSGEAKDSGNFGDLIKVKNLKSGKIVKGYVKKNKIIKIFR